MRTLSHRRISVFIALLNVSALVSGCSSADMKQYFHTLGQVTYDSLKEADRREALEPHERRQ